MSAKKSYQAGGCRENGRWTEGGSLCARCTAEIYERIVRAPGEMLARNEADPGEVESLDVVRTL